MTTTAPVTHLEEAQKLTAEGLVDLYTVTLKTVSGVFRFKNDNSVTWRGNLYEGMASRISGDSRNSDGEESRPLLTVMNPLGIFNDAALAGHLDLATVVRQRVLGKHITSNTNISENRMWYVGRIRELISGQSITLELRNMTEGPNFQIPCRMYIPPEFPMVSL